MARHLNIRQLQDGQIEILCDLDTAKDIADGLDWLDRSEPDADPRISDFVFILATATARFMSRRRN